MGLHREHSARIRTRTSASAGTSPARLVARPTMASMLSHSSQVLSNYGFGSDVFYANGNANFLKAQIDQGRPVVVWMTNLASVQTRSATRRSMDTASRWCRKSTPSSSMATTNNGVSVADPGDGKLSPVLAGTTSCAPGATSTACRWSSIRSSSNSEGFTAAFGTGTSRSERRFVVCGNRRFCPATIHPPARIVNSSHGIRVLQWFWNLRSTSVERASTGSESEPGWSCEAVRADVRRRGDRRA